MISCVIIEDLKVAADYLAKCCHKSGQVELKASFPDVPQALRFLNEHIVDVLFLDVEMPGATGFDLLDHMAYRPKVILTTSKEEYAYNAFQYHVDDFLKKPFTYQRFTHALEKVMVSAEKAVANSSGDFIYIKSSRKLVRVKSTDILYIESMGDYVRFVTAEKNYITYNSLKYLEERINGDLFIRVHRAFIINLQKIEDIRENELYINGTRIPIAKTYKLEIMNRLTIL